MKIAMLAAAATLALGAGAAALPAFADDDDMTAARFERLDERAAQRGIAISRTEAMSIARANGMTRIEEIDLDDDEWELEGRMSDGREIEIDISVRDGRVTDLDIDD